jgi:uncharacterized protein YueI
MDNMNNDDMMKKIEQEKDRALNRQLEKNIFLGEYKERVIAALTKEEVEEKGVYKEIIQALKTKEAKNLKIARDIEFSKIKDYVDEAEKIGINYQLVDGLSYSGNIGLVVSANDALENPVENPIIKSIPERFRDKGLDIIYYESLGEKICEFHKKIIHDELPEFEDKYREITLIDRVLGVKCPIDEKLGGKKRG